MALPMAECIPPVQSPLSGTFLADAPRFTPWHGLPVSKSALGLVSVTESASPFERKEIRSLMSFPLLSGR